MKQIAAGKFKAECLHIMDVVRENKEPITITKHNIPIAKLVPIDELPDRPIYGYLKEFTHIKGDIINPIKEDWDVLH